MALPFQVQNGRLLFNQFYEYLIDLAQLAEIIEELRRRLAVGGQNVLREQVVGAYRQGTATAATNLARLTDDVTRAVTDVLGSQAVLRRSALAGSRVLELMQGFQGDVGTDLARILMQAVQDGTNPRDLVKVIRQRFGVHRRRAETIARTEITGALRRGRWDEARDTGERFNRPVRLIHYSALIPGRTRTTHAQRHGTIHTVEEQAEWYTRNGNSINCLCSATETFLDDDGEPIIGKRLREKLDKQRKAFISAGAGET